MIRKKVLIKILSFIKVSLLSAVILSLSGLLNSSNAQEIDSEKYLYKNKNHPNLSKSSIFDRQFNTVGNISIPLTNYGIMGEDLYWPAGTNNNYSWRSHIIVGGIKEESGDTLISNAGAPSRRFLSSEFTPGATPEVSQLSSSRIYFSTLDQEEWPIKDENGENIVLSSEDSYAEFNDLDEQRHSVYSRGSLGIKIKQRTMLWDLLEYTNAIILEYTIVNVTEDNLKDLFFAIFADPDIDFGWDDDIEYDSENEIILVSDSDGISDRSGVKWSTGTIGYSFLDVPGTASGSKVNSLYMGNNRFLYPNSENGWFLLGDKDAYERLTADSLERETSVSTDVGFYLSTKTFDIDAGDSASVLFCISVSQSKEETVSIIRDLRKSVQFGWVFPGPPPSPELTVFPGDEMVTLSWSDDPVNAIDEFSEITNSPEYRAKDFQGFRIYKRELRSESKLKKIAEYDLIDNKSAARFGLQVGETGIPFTYVDTSVTNGLEYEYAVTSFDLNLDTLSFESDIYDNLTKVKPRTAPSDILLPTTQIEHIAGTADVFRKLELIVAEPSKVPTATYHIKFKVAKNAVSDIAGHHFPLFIYDVINVTNGDTLLKDQEIFTNTKGVPVSGTSAMFNGMILSYQIALHDTTWWIDGFAVENDVGEKFDGNLTIGGISKGLRLHLIKNASIYSRAAWAFTGNDYRIEWVSLPDDSMTLKVTDISNNVEIPFGFEDGYNWGIYVRIKSGGIRKRKVVSFNQSDSKQFPIGFFLSGAIFLFNVENKATVPPSEGDTWIVLTSGDRGLHNGNTFELKTEAVGYGVKSTKKVRVVPNPYFVRNVLEEGYSARRILFTDLPSESTIRIFTVSGELVKTIHHKSLNLLTGSGGTAEWNLLSDYGLRIASGMYFFHVESKLGNQIGKFAVIQ